MSLALQAGERVALLGPNGVGKTTVLRVMAGLAEIQWGTVRRPRKIGYLPQDAGASLLPWLDARANIALCGAPDAALRVTQLDPGALRRWPTDLSGGERQLVALARALATEARTLLLDEPFSALAPRVRASVRAALREWLDARGATLVLVTHDMNDVLALAGRAVVLAKAPTRIVADLDLEAVDPSACAEALRPWMEP